LNTNQAAAGPKTMKNVVPPHLGSAVMEVREQMANIVVDNRRR
jgi:lactate dehydrogenase-like 2-hydroxyacid dehydrogenase